MSRRNPYRRFTIIAGTTLGIAGVILVLAIVVAGVWFGIAEAGWDFLWLGVVIALLFAVGTAIGKLCDYIAAKWRTTELRWDQKHREPLKNFNAFGEDDNA